MSDSDDRLHGGEIWTQKGGSCFTCYTVFINLDVWVIINSPDMRGNIAWDNDPNHVGVFYTKAELLHRFDSMGYECKGHFSDIIKAQLEDAYQGGKEAAHRQRNP